MNVRRTAAVIAAALALTAATAAPALAGRTWAAEPVKVEIVAGSAWD